MIGNASSSLKHRRTMLRYIVTQTCRYAWQWTKNCIKLLIGRDWYYDERLVFFRKYVLHRLGIERIWAITCDADGPSEGPASHAYIVMSTINLARACGLTYLHSPFTHIGHPDRPMPEWVAEWEEIFNLGAGEEPFKGNWRGVVNSGYVSILDIEFCFGWSNRIDELQERSKALIPEFKRKYYLNKTPRANEQLIVAVNIRRREVTAEQHRHMYTSNEKILRMASQVKSLLESHGTPFQIRVYGQGKVADFPELSLLDATFFLEADPVWTMRELVESDILILAKSTFSHYAGLMSSGIKIFENLTMAAPFPPMDDWIPCDSYGAFDAMLFERQLTSLMRDKKEDRSGAPQLRN